MKLDDFSFAQPWWLLLLAALPILAWLQGGRGPLPAVRFSSVQVLRPVAGIKRASWGGFARLLFFLSLGLLILALARPRLGKTHDTIESSGVDIMLTLDVSGSMAEQDFTIGGLPATRLDAVKDVTRRFIQSRPNDRIGIVVFAASPFLMSPATLDHDWLLQNLERLNLNLLRQKGTYIGGAIASAANRLESKAAKSKIMILLTDGEQTVGDLKPEAAAEAARTMGIKIYTIGAGSDEPPMRLPLMLGNRHPFDDKTLRKVAEIGGGQYFRATDTDTLTRVFEEIDKLEKTEVKLKRKVEWRELLEWFIAAGTGLLLLRAALLHTWWRTLP